VVEPTALAVLIVPVEFARLLLERVDWKPLIVSANALQTLMYFLRPSVQTSLLVCHQTALAHNPVCHNSHP